MTPIIQNSDPNPPAHSNWAWQILSGKLLVSLVYGLSLFSFTLVLRLL